MHIIVTDIPKDKRIGQKERMLAVGPVSTRLARKEDWTAEVDKIRQIVANSPKNFLSGELLEYVRCPMPQISCSNSKRFFIDAAEAGMLIQTDTIYWKENGRGGYDKREMRVYVKGLAGNFGNALAFEPEQSRIYSLIVRGGELTLIEPLKTYRDRQIADKIMQLQIDE